MRKLWIDTDTASDDAVALLMALREPSVEVLGISVVMGNVSLERAVRNALISVERAGTYAPPVFANLFMSFVLRMCPTIGLSYVAKQRGYISPDHP